MKALISPAEGGRIVQVESKDFPVAEPLFWTDCPPTVTTEYWFVNGEFVAPPPVEITPEQNALTAASMLALTDWVNQPDVVDPNNVPRLANKAEFDQYRLAVRRIFLNPPAGVVEWPLKPAAQWVTE